MKFIEEILGIVAPILVPMGVRAKTLFDEQFSLATLTIDDAEVLDGGLFEHGLVAVVPSGVSLCPDGHLRLDLFLGFVGEDDAVPR